MRRTFATARMAVVLAAIVAGSSYGPCLHAAGAATPASVASAPHVPEASWLNTVSAAKLIKNDLAAANYQYSLVGNGGLDGLLDPGGFTGTTPPHAPYAPGIYYQYWWDNKTKRADPFTLDGGSLSDTGVDEGTITGFQQTLDIRTGVLTSAMQLRTCPSQSDCYAHTSTRTEFVTPAGQLVIQVRDTAANHFAIQVKPNDNYMLSFAQDQNGLAATASRADSNALALSVTAAGAAAHADAGRGLVSAEVGPSQPATFYVAAAGVETPTPGEASLAKANRAAERGYPAAARSNAQFWDGFWRRSEISVPDSDVMKWYARSQYYLGALMANSSIPPGVYGPRNINFNGGPALGYDEAFPFLAMLGANQPDVSGKTADWIEATLPAAEELASHYTYDGKPSTGAKYPVVSSWDGSESNAFGPTPASSGWEAAPSANAALFDIMQAQYTDDPARLLRARQVLEKVTQYQLDNSARDPAVGNQWVSQKYFWQWNPAPLSFQKGAITDQAALLWSLREACKLHVGPATWCQYAKEVYLPTAFDPVREAPVINGFLGTDPPGIRNSTFPMMHPLYFLNDLDASDPLTWPTYMNVTSTNDINYTFNRGWAAVVAAKSDYGDDALRRLHRLIDERGETSPSSGVLWNDTFLSECVTCGPTNTPEVGAHAALMLATQHMLFDGDSDSQLKIFPGLPTDWQSRGAAFEKLAARGGLLVSGRYTTDGTSVTVTNASATPQERSVLVRIPAGSTGATLESSTPGPRPAIQQIADHTFAKVRLDLAPGKTTSFTVIGQTAGQWTTVDDTSPAISYTGNWQTASGKPDFVAGTAHYTGASGASASTTFDGTAVRIVADSNAEHGQYRIAIDGTVVGDFDTWAPTSTTGNIIFARDGLTPGRHTITLIATGIQDLYSDGAIVSLDAIQYITSQQGTTVLSSDAAHYSAHWTTVPADGSDGVAHQSDTAGARAVLDFEGSEIRVLGTRGPDGGLMDVSVDGVPEGTVDTYSYSPATGEELFRSNDLGPGHHQLTITALGTRSADSAGVKVSITGFDAIGASQTSRLRSSYLLAFVGPNPSTAASAATVPFTVSLWGQGSDPLSGVIKPIVPDGWSADATPFTIDTHGDQAATSVQLPVHVSPTATGADYQVNFEISTSNGLELRQAATVSIQNILYSFDDGTTQGWQAEAPAGDLAAVTSTANGPQVPFQGSRLLQFSTGNISAPSAQRTIYAEPTTSLDLSNAKDVYAYVDSWGIPPYTQNHMATITLYDGTEHISASAPFAGNRWDRLQIDVSSWPGRTHITRMEVTYNFDIPPDANGNNVYVVQADVDSVGYDT